MLGELKHAHARMPWVSSSMRMRACRVRRRSLSNTLVRGQLREFQAWLRRMSEQFELVVWTLSAEDIAMCEGDAVQAAREAGAKDASVVFLGGAARPVNEPSPPCPSGG